MPLKLDFSLRMRKYRVLFTSDRGAFSVFRRELGRFVLAPNKVGVGEKTRTEMQMEMESSMALKVASIAKDKVVVEPCSHARSRRVIDAPTRPAEKVCSEEASGSIQLPAVIEDD